MLILLLGLVLFLGIHSIRIPGEHIRNAQIAKFGLEKWKGIYSIVSLVGFVLIIWGYALSFARHIALSPIMRAVAE